jgi:hypothetical protein
VLIALGSVPPSPIVSVTSQVPAVVYTYDGFSLEFEPPSPKAQSHVVGDPVEVSLNWTVRGAVPEMGDAVNDATSGVAVVVVVVGTAVVAVVVGTAVVAVVVGTAVVAVVVGTAVVAVVVGTAVVAVVVGTAVVAVVVGTAVVAVVVGTAVVAVVVGTTVVVVTLPLSAATGITTQAMHTSITHPMRRMRRLFTGHHREFHQLSCAL